MAKNYDAGQKPIITPGLVGSTGQTAETGEVKHRLVDPAQLDIPQNKKGFGAERSKLADVIEAGLTQLAKAQGWESKDNALGVLVKAMAGTQSAALPETIDALPLEFQQLLRSVKKDVDVGKLKQLKADAKQLLTLAVVALGAEGLTGLKKGDQETQLAADVIALKDALADVLKKPTDERKRILDNGQAALTFAAGVFARGEKALAAAQLGAQTRLDALAGILRIVGRYAEG